MAIDPDLITTKRVGELPIGIYELTDKIPHEKGSDLYQGTLSDLISFIAPLVSAIQYQVITLHVNQAYIDDNFILTGSTTGLGINLMSGFAICNGNNGTINKDGRVGIAYGEVTNVIGQVGGEDTHSLTIEEMPAHNHNFLFSASGTTGGGVITTGNSDEGPGSFGMGATGGNAPHNNRQRFLVELQVMKL